MLLVFLGTARMHPAHIRPNRPHSIVRTAVATDGSPHVMWRLAVGWGEGVRVYVWCVCVRELLRYLLPT